MGTLSAILATLRDVFPVVWQVFLMVLAERKSTQAAQLKGAQEAITDVQIAQQVAAFVAHSNNADIDRMWDNADATAGGQLKR